MSPSFLLGHTVPFVGDMINVLRCALLALVAKGSSAQAPIACTTANSQEVCPKYNVTNPMILFFQSMGIGLDIAPNATGADQLGNDIGLACCIDVSQTGGIGVCGNENDCENMMSTGFGVGIQALVGAFFLFWCCFCCCCAMLCYCCCCRSKGGDDYSDSASDSESGGGRFGGGRQSGGGGGGGSLSKSQKRGFLEALEGEYCDGQEGAVGDWQNDSGIRGANSTIQDVEDEVRNANDAQRVIDRYRKKWGL